MRTLGRIITILSLCLAACGYHTPQAGDSWAGGDARVLHVELFKNRATEPYLENYLTDEVAHQMMRSRLVQLTEDIGKAELLLMGTINSFKTSAIAYDSRDRITEYRATMNIETRLVRTTDSEVLWQDRITQTEDFLATVDKTLQLEGQELAAREVAKRLAEDIYARLFNTF